MDPDKPFSLEDLIDKDEWEPPRTDEGRSGCGSGANARSRSRSGSTTPSCSRSCGPSRLGSCPRGPSWRGCWEGTATRPTLPILVKIYRNNAYLDMRNYSVTDALSMGVDIPFMAMDEITTWAEKEKHADYWFGDPHGRGRGVRRRRFS